MKTLFTIDEAYNAAGGKLDDELLDALDTILNRWKEKGYKVEEIKMIVLDTLDSIISELILTKSLKHSENMRELQKALDSVSA